VLTIAARNTRQDDARMSTPAPEQKKPRNWWIWVSAALALVAAGLLIWALSLKSDRDSAHKELDKTKEQVASIQKELDSATQAEPSPTPDDGGAGGAVVAAGALAGFKALLDELGATQEDLDAAEQAVEEANRKAEQAEKDAADAKKRAEQADNETEKARAEAEQAKAEQQATESKAAVARDCANAYLSAFGTLLESDDPESEADAVREQFSSITDECREALAGG
jgi:hypothetical protein